MTIEEKLDHFKTLCFDDARQRSDKMLSDYTESLKKILEEHKRDAGRQADMQVAAETEKIEREINKQLSIEQINIKREYSRKQEELKSMLLSELRNRLALFMDSSDYQKYLEREVKNALAIAGTAPITIYLDPSDREMINRLSMHTGARIEPSDTTFLGGIRAVIPDKNILIDNSFQTKLEELTDKFQFRLGGR